MRESSCILDLQASVVVADWWLSDWYVCLF